MTGTITLPTEISHSHKAIELDEHDIRALEAAIDHAIELSNTHPRQSVYDEDAGVYVRPDDGDLATMAMGMAVRLYADIAREIIAPHPYGLLRQGFTVTEAINHVVSTGVPSAIGIVEQPKPETDEGWDSYVRRYVLITNRLHEHIVHSLLPFGFDALIQDNLASEMKASRPNCDEDEIKRLVATERRNLSAIYRAIDKRF
jgi:hypothetical protein